MPGGSYLPLWSGWDASGPYNGSPTPPRRCGVPRRWLVMLSIIMLGFAMVHLYPSKETPQISSRPGAPATVYPVPPTQQADLDEIITEIRPVRPEWDSNAVSREQWIQAFLDTDITGDFQGEPLADLCLGLGAGNGNEPKLVIRCDNVAGAPGTVRQHILNCVRLAIELGAGLVVPTLEGTQSHRLGHLFDEWQFAHVLGKYCSGLRLYNDVSDAPGTMLELLLELGQFKELRKGRQRYVVDPELIKEAVERWINQNVPEDMKHLPVHIFMGQDTSFIWPTDQEFDGVAKNFGRILRYNEDIRRVAATVLYNLQQKYVRRDRFHPQGGLAYGESIFAAARLHTAREDSNYRFAGFGLQASHCRRILQETKDLPVAYLGGSDEFTLTNFAHSLAPLPAVTKTDLLSDAELDRLKALTEDQQAVVDLLVAERASLVLDADGSTATWAMALRRASSVEGSAGGFPAAGCGIGLNEAAAVLLEDCPMHLKVTEVWKDDFTVVVGDGASMPRNMTEIVRRIWP